ncbi:MAG: SurA N-terminal domain-containing protein [Fimbriimonadaceae bacterium]|nr:SurA N-terminal domain-containing protein [Chitinophagales bacterium]
MGIISTLRNKSWIVLIFIALALISFLVMSVFNSNSNMIGNKHNEFASVNGKEITPQEFDAKSSEVLLQYLTQSRQYTNYKYGKFPIDQQTENQIKEQAWTNLLNESLIDAELEKLGLQVTQEEVNNLVYGNDPHPYFASYYSALSADGKYDPAKVGQYFQQVSNQEVWQQNPQAEEEYYNFVMREKLAKQDYMQTKYTSLFTKADYVPQWMIKRDYEVKNRRVNFDFVDIPYATIPDSTVQVTEKDMKDYFERNKNKFKQKTDSRVVEYVVWDFIPTPQDSLAILTKLNESVTKMQEAKNDSTYISIHSEDPQKVEGIYQSRINLYDAGIDSSIVDSIFMKQKGSLVGPYFENGYYKVASIRERENMPDSTDVRHILVAVQTAEGGLDTAASKILADSILTAIRGGAAFDSLAIKYSQDGSGAKGGELGWSTPATNYVKPFKDYVFKTGRVGEYEIVKVSYGYHIINIKEQKDRRDYVQLYYLSKEIQPGKITSDSTDLIASEFFENHQTAESFEQGIKENNLQKRTTPPLNKNQFEITGLPESKQIINWAFNAEKGQFEYFNTTTNQVVIAHLKDVRNKGIPEMEDVEEQVRAETIQELKGKQLSQKLQDALKNSSDLTSVAQAVGSTVKSSQNASLGSASAPGVGREAKLVGVVMATEQSKQTKVVAGNRSVYVANITGITEPVPTEDYSLNMNQLIYSMRTRLGGQNGQNAITNLVDKADVVDNRNLYQ